MYAIQCPFSVGGVAVARYAGTVRDWEVWGADGVCVFSGRSEAEHYLANYVWEQGARIVPAAGLSAADRAPVLSVAEAYRMLRRACGPNVRPLPALAAWCAARMLAALSRTPWGWTTKDADWLVRELACFRPDGLAALLASWDGVTVAHPFAGQRS